MIITDRDRLWRLNVPLIASYDLLGLSIAGCNDIMEVRAGLIPNLEIYVPDKTDPRQDLSKFKVKLSEAIEAGSIRGSGPSEHGP